MAAARGPRGRGRGLAPGDQRRRGRRRGRDPGHRRPAEDTRRRGRGAPAGARRQPLRQLRRAADARRTVGVVGGGDRRSRRRSRWPTRSGRSSSCTAATPSRRRPPIASPSSRTPRSPSATAPSSRRSSARRRHRRAHSRRGVGRTRELELGGLFIYVGLDPNSDCVRDLIELDAEGRIPTDPGLRTELAGVFAAGIVRRDSLGRRPSRPARARRRPRPRTATWAATRDAGSTPAAAAAGKEAHMAEADRPRPARLSAEGHRQAARPAPAEPRGPDASTSSTACSTTPRSSSTSCTRGSPSTCPRAHQAHPAARELGRRPRDVRGDPGRRGRRVLAVGL